MRTSFQPVEGIRTTYFATLARRGIFKTAYGWRDKILLKNIRDSHHKLLEDHVSITDPASLQQMATLKAGDFIQFSAVVRSYIRGYRGDDIDLRLKNPESIDYMLYDIRNIVKWNLEVRDRYHKLSGVEDLLKKKRVHLGVC